MIERILIPLDGSEAAEAALAYAELLPSRRVRLLRVETDSEGALLADDTAWDAWGAAREGESRAYLERAVSDYGNRDGTWKQPSPLAIPPIGSSRFRVTQT